MTAGPYTVDSASAIRARLAGLNDSQRVPGTLTQWADEGDNRYWEFVGNGETTSTQFVQAALQRETQAGNTQTQPVADNPNFAAAAATTLLNTQTPNQPIPRGDVRELALRDLVQLIAPFLQSYAAGQAATGGGGTGGPRPTGSLAINEDERNRVATGQVLSQGLTLPLD